MVSHARAGGEPLLAIASRNVGVRRAIKAMTFMAAWDRARYAMRRETISLTEYADWWKVSHGSSYREQATFRQAFPGESTPDRLLDLAAAQWDATSGLSGLGRVVVDL